MSKVFIVLILYMSSAAFAETDICADLRAVFEKQILPELNTGLQKNLALVVDHQDNLTFSKPLMIKKDLWKKRFLLSGVIMPKPLETESLEIIQDEICSALNASFKQLSPPKDANVFAVLNANTESISHIMEDWSQKHVGLYKNMGLRVRWNSMSDLQKSQKIFALKSSQVRP